MRAMSSEVAKPQRSHSKKCVSTRAAFSLGSMRHRCIVARQEGQVRKSIRKAGGLWGLLEVPWDMGAHTLAVGAVRSWQC